jgi:hypothetical protein
MFSLNRSVTITSFTPYLVLYLENSSEVECFTLKALHDDNFIIKKQHLKIIIAVIIPFAFCEEKTIDGILYSSNRQNFQRMSLFIQRIHG